MAAHCSSVMVVLPAEGRVYLFQRLSGLAARRSICGMTISRGDGIGHLSVSWNFNSLERQFHSLLFPARYQLSTT
jgi:hypothetical protein